MDQQEEKKPEREKRRDWLLLLLLLLILLCGCLCVTLAGQQAISFGPNWRLNTNMDSNIDPNSRALTDQPHTLLEPLNPDILTQPAWLNSFLTPGASNQTAVAQGGTPLGTQVSTTTTAIPTITVITTATIVTPSVVPTNTLVYVPPPPTKVKPAPPTTNIDLQITNDDGSPTYMADSIVTYTVVITNSGPNAVTGTVVSASLPAHADSWDWACTTVTNASGCDAVTGSTANFTDAVDIQSGGSITYTVSVSIKANAAGNLNNTVSVSVPGGYTDTNLANNSRTDTDTYQPSAKLSITKSDGVTTYGAGDTLQYTIVVTNNGPDNVTGARVQDDLTDSRISSVSWTCTADTGSACGNSSGISSIDELINLNVGKTVTYDVTVNIVSGSVSGNFTNTANVIAPAGIVARGTNSATDTDSLYPTTYLDIGTGKDGNSTTLPAGGPPLILSLSSPVTVDGTHAGYDIVYYEQAASSGILMDWVILDVSSDGSTWTTVLNWGDTNSDVGTSIARPLTGNSGGTCVDGFGTEIDDCDINSTFLYNSTGVAIDLDAFGIPSGTIIYYIRITIPPGGVDSGAGVDGIYVIP